MYSITWLPRLTNHEMLSNPILMGRKAFYFRRFDVCFHLFRAVWEFLEFSATSREKWKKYEFYEESNDEGSHEKRKTTWRMML